MTKTICDICGKEMSADVSKLSIKDYKFRISSYGKIWDVCNDCQGKLNEWLEQRKVEGEGMI